MKGPRYQWFEITEEIIEKEEKRARLRNNLIDFFLAFLIGLLFCAPIFYQMIFKD